MEQTSHLGTSSATENLDVVSDSRDQSDETSSLIKKPTPVSDGDGNSIPIQFDLSTSEIQTDLETLSSRDEDNIVVESTRSTPVKILNKENNKPNETVKTSEQIEEKQFNSDSRSICTRMDTEIENKNKIKCYKDPINTISIILCVLAVILFITNLVFLSRGIKKKKLSLDENKNTNAFEKSSCIFDDPEAKLYPSNVLVIQNYKHVNNINGTNLTIIGYRSCAGTIIDKESIITAAHCISKSSQYENKTYNITPNNYYQTLESMFKVYIGVSTSEDKQSCKSHVVNVEKIIEHPDYSPQSKSNDIAIFKLSKSIELGQNAILPNRLSSTFADANLKVITASWENNETPIAFKVAEISAINSSVCTKAPKRFKKNLESQICTNYNREIDTCKVGSGLYVNQKVDGMQKPVLVGIASYSFTVNGSTERGCVYTRVGHYFDWLKANSNV